MLEESPDIPLQGISDRLIVDFKVDVAPQGIAKRIDGLCYSFKQTRVEVDRMNNDENKNKRKIYAEEYMKLLGDGFQP